MLIISVSRLLVIPNKSNLRWGTSIFERSATGYIRRLYHNAWYGRCIGIVKSFSPLLGQKLSIHLYRTVSNLRLERCHDLNTCYSKPEHFHAFFAIIRTHGDETGIAQTCN